MKYVVIRVEDGENTRELPFIFPDEVVHREFANRIKHLLAFDTEGKFTTVSAGFVMDGVKAKCYGKSESLNLESRVIDTDLIRACK